MKRFLLILAAIASSLCVFAVDPDPSSNFSNAVRQYMLGYVDSAVYMTISMADDVLPFNIDSTAVKSVEVSGGEPTSVHGLRIGQYSLISNEYSFSVTISHDKLSLVYGNPKPGEDTSLDYRLYLFTEGSKFKSCLSGESNSIVLTYEDYPNSYTTGSSMLAAAEKSMYLTIAVSDTSNIAAGDYESYITFIIEGGT